MTRINHVDHVLMLLRQQLQGLAKANRSRRGGRSAKAGPQQRRSAAKRIAAMARAGDLSEEDLARSLIGALLVDEFGEAAANDHKFQKLVEEVHRIIASDPQASRTMAEAVKKVGGSG